MNRRQALGVCTAPLFAAPLLASACGKLGKAPGQGDAAGYSGFSSKAPVAYLNDEQVVAFAKRIEDELTARQVQVAIVFRTGRARSKLPKGISYTHGAFWAHTPVMKADGDGVAAPGDDMGAYAVYNLYHGDGKTEPRDHSSLVQDYPLDFARGTAVDDVAVLIPTPELQAGIITAMNSPVYEKMHVPSYSLIANPLDPRHQNCNEFMLDVIGAVLWKTEDYAEVKRRLRETYTPTPIGVSPIERILGPMTDNRIKLDDQGDKIVTSTYESIAAFLKAQGALAANIVIDRTKPAARSL
jgi:hypothetical protein